MSRNREKPEMTEQPQGPNIDPSGRAPKKRRKKWPLVLGGIVLLIIVISIASNSGGSKSTTAATTSPAPTSMTTSFPAAEMAALNALHPGCQEDYPKLDAEAKKALELMQRNGVTDETTLTVLQHLRQSIPPGTPDMNCANQLGAYVTLRGNGGR